MIGLTLRLDSKSIVTERRRSISVGARIDTAAGAILGLPDSLLPNKRKLPIGLDVGRLRGGLSWAESRRKYAGLGECSLTLHVQPGRQNGRSRVDTLGGVPSGAGAAGGKKRAVHGSTYGTIAGSGNGDGSSSMLRSQTLRS